MSPTTAGRRLPDQAPGPAGAPDAGRLDARALDPGVLDPGVLDPRVLDAVTVGVVVHAEDGSVLTNAAARGMLAGLPSSVLDNAIGAVAPSGPHQHFTLTTPRPDGSTRRLAATAVPHRGAVVTTVRDLTAERAAASGSAPGEARAEADHAALRRSLSMAERRLRATVEHSPIGSALLSPHGRVLHANRALGRLLDLDPADLNGRWLVELTHPDDATREAPLAARVLARSAPSYQLEKRFVRPSGQSVWTRVTVAPVCDDDGQVLQLVLQAVDLTETRRAVQVMDYQATHDPLTGLGNRPQFLARIARLLRRRVRRVTVLVCDLDGFRVLNDSAGPGFGDLVLREVAARLREAAGPGAHLARLAADEFAVVTDAPDDDHAALVLAHRLRDAVGRPARVSGRQVMLSVSVGVARSAGVRTEGERGGDAPTGSIEAATLLQDAGTALHRAKLHGRGGCHLLDDALRQATRDRLDIETELRTGLARGQLRLHLQPIVDLTRGAAVVGREALVRWQHPELGLLPPSRFLAVAEESGLIDELGRWVIAEAARIAAARPGSGYVAVNVSASHVRGEGLVEDVAAALDATGLEPSRLVVELTESVMLGDAAEGRDQLEKLDELGVRMVVDDFGTGFSALSHLRDLPVSGIKIDRSFTQGLGRDPHCDRIVEALTGLAQGLDVDLVAEGVETETQAELLTGIGCVHAQGYLFGRPEPITADAVSADHR